MSCNPQYNPYTYGHNPCPCPPQPIMPQYPLICVGTGPTGSAGVGSTGTTGPKSFIIDHPTKPDNYLVHACLEGPEAGVYYRGITQVRDRFAKGSQTCFVEIELPDYVSALATNFTVQVTHIFEEGIDEMPKTYAATTVKDGKFRIYGPPGKVAWAVYGSRSEFEVEPLKSSVDVKGDGPYKYI